MDAGSLNKRVTIQSPAEVRGADYADVQRTWTDVASVWASIEPLSARELFQNREVSSELTTRVRMRYLSGVSAKQRVLFGARVFEIQSVLNPGEMNIELELLCAEMMSG